MLEPPRIVMTAGLEEDFCPIGALEEVEKDRAKLLDLVNA